MKTNNFKLGSLETSEKLIKDLYLTLRDSLKKWSEVTKQTPQARMGYVGQHLTSVVTSYPGSRSGARGKDLIISSSEYAEIKTCYRVDQLGRCNKCNSTVSSIEDKCSNCDSTDIKRNDDSKWLIGIRNDDEFSVILDPKYYFLVLFEFSDITSSSNNDIQSSIWRVDPKSPGFSFCMIDYYLTIRAKSKSKAPFNLWPYQLKFDVMSPLLIYRSIIKSDSTIDTKIFPGRNTAQEHPVKKLTEYSRTQNLTLEGIKNLAGLLKLKVDLSKPKNYLLDEIEEERDKTKIPDSELADALAKVIYLPRLIPVKDKIPKNFKSLYSDLM